MSGLSNLLRRLFKPKPCDCDGCTSRVRATALVIACSQGLHIKVGRDGKLHWRAKSSIRGFDQ